MKSLFSKKWTWHLAFWSAYTLFWHLVSTPDPRSWPALVTSIIFTLVNAAAVYFNLYALMPRYLYGKQYGKYVGSLAANVVLSSVLLAALLYGWFFLISPESVVGFFSEPYQVIGSTVGSNTTAVFLTTAIYLLRRHVLMERRQKELEREKLETELKFLKSQLNPHFLFNALNNIYMLIRRDPEAAAEALAGFSDLLRYQLYETDDSRVRLAREMESLEQYVRLAQLRKSRSLQVSFQSPEQLNGEQVTPLLLLPLVENAFKHVSPTDGFIRINSTVNDGALDFSITNNYEKSTEENRNGDGGIGLANLRKRLQLHYPDRHKLTIDDTGGVYSLHLKLIL